MIERALKKQDEHKKKRVSLVERAAEKATEHTPATGMRAIGSPRVEPAPAEAPAKPATDNTGEAAIPAEKQKRGIGKRPYEPRDPSSMGPLAVTSTATEDNDRPEARQAAMRTAADKPPIAGADVTGVTPPANPSKGGDSVKEIDLLALQAAGYITPDMPPNLLSEEFRIIKRSLVLNAFATGETAIERSNIILVTSSNPSEGKTFCAINLALSIATEQDLTVLLIDADFSKPEVLNRLGVSGGKGLMDVVADKDVEFGDCLIRTSIPNLVLCPAGRQHNLTTELLASDRMQELVREISQRYPDRIVIFDSPPVLASSAASVMALYMGQTVFVIEAERTSEPEIKESLELISGCGNISLLLNKTQFGSSEKKFASYYGYGGR